MQLFDITRTLSPALEPWPGDTRYRHEWQSRIADGSAANVSTLVMSAHSGTHVDSPYHYAQEGLKLDEMALDIHLGPATVVALDVDELILPEHFDGVNLAAIERLLIKTRASARRDDEWWDSFPYFSIEAAALLGEMGVRLIGTDAPSVDHLLNETMEAHRVLYRHNVAILENVQLSDVTPGEYELIALPLKVQVDGSPVRAVLRR